MLNNNESKTTDITFCATKTAFDISETQEILICRMMLKKQNPSLTILVKGLEL